MGAPMPNMEPVENASAEALLDSLKTIDPGERRKHASVFNYWLSIRGDRQFPPIRDLDPMEISDAGPWSVLLEMIGGGEDAVIRHFGQEVRGDAEVEKIGDAPSPSLLSCIHGKLPIVAACREAMAFEDSYEFEGRKQRCWVTLLPFSANGTWIDFVYGYVSLDGAKAAVEDEPERQPKPRPPKSSSPRPRPSPRPPKSSSPRPRRSKLRWRKNPRPPWSMSRSKTRPSRSRSRSPVSMTTWTTCPPPTSSRYPSPSSNSPNPSPKPKLSRSSRLRLSRNRRRTCSNSRPKRNSTIRSPHMSPSPNPSPSRASFTAKVKESLASVGFYGKVVQSGPELPAEAFVEETSPVEEPATVAASAPLPAYKVEGSMQDKLTDIRALAEEAHAAQVRSNQALFAGLSAAYDFALDAEDEPEDYLKLVEAQGLKIQLRSPMKPVVRLAFEGMCDDPTIAKLEAVLAWALKQDLPRGSLRDRIEAEGGIGPILRGEGD